MAETFCVKHTGKPAVGYCSKCNKPYCEDCLDMETGKPVCHDCLKAKAAGGMPVTPVSTPAPMAGSPLNFKGKGLDDDPLGLFSSGGGSKTEAPKLTPPPFKPPVAPAPKPIAPPASKPLSPMPSLDQLGKLSSPSEKISSPTTKASMDLDSLIKDPQPLRPPFPQPSSPNPAPRSFNEGGASPMDTPGMKTVKKKNPLMLLQTWAKSIGQRIYGFFDDLAVKFRVPTFAVIALVLVIVVGSIVGMNLSLSQTDVPLADSIQPIHFVQVNAGQVAEMDVTAYSELQNQVQTMGFQPILQMTIPQLSSNFFDVGMKQDAGAYSEIIKMAGQLAPHLSFVTVFTNGVWFSTNAWQGTNQSLEYLVSEFYPDDTPDQLWVQHVQTLTKLKQDKGWEVQPLSENRYMAALSDHLRWFLDKKGIPAYQADFNLWH